MQMNKKHKLLIAVLMAAAVFFGLTVGVSAAGSEITEDDLREVDHIWLGNVHGDYQGFDYVYPVDGNTYTMRRISLHAVKIKGTVYPSYCLEPMVDNGSSYRGRETSRENSPPQSFASQNPAPSSEGALVVLMTASAVEEHHM